MAVISGVTTALVRCTFSTATPRAELGRIETELKKIFALGAALCALLTGCISPNWIRLAPENKDIDATVTTVYGTITIHSRVNPNGTNGLGPLPTVTPVQSGILISK